MKFSVVIATLNAEAFVQRAVLSVLTQVYTQYEVIVQDAGSTDGTLDALKKFGSRINLVSGPDTGVYDAWNKALARAGGDWTLFLGADDFLWDNEVLAKCGVYLARLPEETIFAYGSLRLGKNGKARYIIDRSLAGMYQAFLSDSGLPFPATFTRTSALKAHPFDAGYRIAGDFDFAARLVSANNVARLPLTISFMEQGGLSSNTKYARLLAGERLRVLRTHVLPKAGMLLEAALDNADKELSLIE